jgi:hypothetical protein
MRPRKGRASTPIDTKSASLTPEPRAAWVLPYTSANQGKAGDYLSAHTGYSRPSSGRWFSKQKPRK